MDAAAPQARENQEPAINRKRFRWLDYPKVCGAAAGTGVAGGHSTTALNCNGLTISGTGPELPFAHGLRRFSLPNPSRDPGGMRISRTCPLESTNHIQQQPRQRPWRVAPLRIFRIDARPERREPIYSPCPRPLRWLSRTRSRSECRLPGFRQASPSAIWAGLISRARRSRLSGRFLFAVCVGETQPHIRAT